MMPFRLLLTVALAAVLAPQLHAAVSARVCNTGQLNVDVAVASEVSGLFAGGWAISAWHSIAPRDCKSIYHHPTACQDLATQQSVYNQWTPCARIYVAYAFRDSTGVWGAVDFRDKNWLPHGEKICVSQGGIGETRPAPDAYCAKPGWFLIPVAAKMEPRGGNSYQEFSQQYPGYTASVAVTTSDRAIPLGPGATPGRPQSPAPKADDNTALKLAAGIGAAVIVGAIISAIVDESNCNSVPEPFERGTLNAEFLRKPVVRRTCERAHWYFRDGQGKSIRLRYFITTSDRSVGSVLDPPQQVDNAGKADSAANPEVRRIVSVLDNMLGSRGGTNVTNYGKFRYRPVGESPTETWVNLVALDFSRATIGTESGLSTMTIPCLNDYDCALLMTRDGHITFPRFKLYLQGQGNWQAVFAEMNKLRAIFPKEPMVQAN